ncbi:MAG: FkbM family methyltransferase [Gemmatimonas sp.]|nr:FkbM family methyltransferase [Gemmatimonas sp.]
MKQLTIGDKLRGGIRRVGAEFRRRVRKDRFMDALVRHLSDTRTSCVIDVGANCGQYGLFLRSLGYRGEIISFEPVRESFDELLDRTLSDPGWKAFPLALGEVAGEMPINIVPRSDFNSLKEPNDLALREYQGVEPIGTESVQVERLDRVLPDLLGAPPRSLLLKTDTQGFDLEVLRGAGDLVTAFNGLQAEVSVTPIYKDVPSLAETLTEYASFGFEPVAFRTFAWSAGKLIEMDGLFRNTRELQ